MPSDRKHLNNKEFVDFCYQQILKREADETGMTAYVKELQGGQVTREQMLIKFITSLEFEAKQKCLEFVPNGHFYSAVPSNDDRQSYLKKTEKQAKELPGIDLNLDVQLNLLHRFKEFYIDCPFSDHKQNGHRYYFINPAYSYTDALVLHSMMRHFKPKKIIEIGSGFSSCAMLDTNDLFFESSIEFTFIEPYPELLNSLITKDDKQHTFLPSRIQDVDKSIFNELKQNDILFIDSTHVSKLGSDVNTILFEILPTLKPGVLVHFHDIFWPFDYPKNWIDEGRAWNEAYILRAFLEHNSNFEIVYFANYLYQFENSWIAENMPDYLKNPGGNIWLRKKA